MITQEDLQSRVAAIAGEANVTGISVGLDIGGESIVAHHGIANAETGLPVRADTLFAAGSVTKVFTVTLMMSLVDDGLIGLDDPVVAHLPEFRLNDEDLARRVTVRMLLNHSAGLPGYAMYDLEKGPDMIARGLAVLNGFDFVSPPGDYWSYSNAGMLVTGRLTEKLTGKTWDAALDERVLKPLGCHATTITERIILDSVAVGHTLDPATNQPKRMDVFQLDRSNGPAGTSLWCDADALLRFGRMHLRNGMGPGGTRILSEESARAMQSPQVKLPWGVGAHWGFGWNLRESGGVTIPWHSGGNAGMHSLLSIVPAHDAAVSVLTNNITGATVTQRITDDLLRELFDIPSVAPPVLPEAPVAVDLSPYPGHYVADEGGVVVTEQDGKLVVAHEVTPAKEAVMKMLHFSFPPPPMSLTPFDTNGRFISEYGMPVSFVREDGEDRPAFVYVGRIYRREG